MKKKYLRQVIRLDTVLKDVRGFELIRFVRLKITASLFETPRQHHSQVVVHGHFPQFFQTGLAVYLYACKAS